MTKDFFKEPDGFQWGSFTNRQGAQVRTGHATPEGEVKGTVVILTGFRESIEKYFEVAGEMLDRGYAVWMMDWRGQGGSERYLGANPQKSHHEGYDEQIADLDDFARTVASAATPPLFVMAHSMGAHIALRYMKECENVFSAAMLSAPMIDIATGSFPRPLARQMAKFAKAGNYLEKYVPGGSDWTEDKNRFEGNPKTGDKERFEAQADLARKNAALKTGDPTYGWIYHTFESIDILNREAYLKTIHTPILMEISGKEVVVDRAAQEKAAGLLPNCKRVDIPAAKHEIWMEADALRCQWLDAVDVFMEEQRKLALVPPKKPDQRKGPPPPGMG